MPVGNYGNSQREFNMRPKSSDFFVQKGEVESRFYSKKGDADYTDENNNPRLVVENSKVCAKATKDRLGKNIGQNPRVSFSYYIKTTPNKTLYNPIERYTIEPNMKGNFIDKICKQELVYTEVSESIFSKYLMFLQTENIKWLKEAQREIK